MSVGSVHNIRKKYLPNVNYLHGGRPQLLNKEMERSFVLQVMGRVSTALDVVRHVEHDFRILVSAQIVMRALHRSDLYSQPNFFDNKCHIFLTKMSRHALFLLEFTNTRQWMNGEELFSHMS